VGEGGLEPRARAQRVRRIARQAEAPAAFPSDKTAFALAR
jgi:hypothetical protein